MRNGGGAESGRTDLPCTRSDTSFGYQELFRMVGQSLGRLMTFMPFCALF